MNIKPLLKYKNLGIKIDSLGQTGFNFPKGASTVDLVMGISKKGDFQISTIKDNLGNLLKREFSFKDDKGNLDFIEKTYEKKYKNGNKIITTNTIYRHNNHPISHKIINYENNKNNLLIKKEIMNPDLDFHSIGIYKKGKTPKKLEYNWCWDDFKPNIINNDLNSDIKSNTELIPIIISNENPKRINERIKHISKIFEKKYDIQGIPNPVNRISEAEFKAFNIEENALGMASTEGNIFIIKDKTDSLSIYEILSHEYKHMSDFINIYRIKKVLKDYYSSIDKYNENFKRFIDRCLSKGFWQENSKEEKEFIDLWLTFIKQNNDKTNYLDKDIEKRAIEEQKKSIKFFDEFYQKLVEYLV